MGNLLSTRDVTRWVRDIVAACLVVGSALNSVVAAPFDSKSASDGGQSRGHTVLARRALAFVRKNGFSQSFFLHADLGAHSGTHRFFVWSFKRNAVVDRGLVSHGCCQHAWGSDKTKTKPRMSNAANSHCSSVGKYRIGRRGKSQWGIGVNYRLHGLDRTNSNAYDRLIVLHSWKAVPNDPVFPKGTPEGWGCPAVSNDMMRRVDALLRREVRPVLLWITR